MMAGKTPVNGTTPFSVGNYLIISRPDGRSEIWYDKNSWLVPDKDSLTQLLINRILELQRNYDYLDFLYEDREEYLRSEFPEIWRHCK